MFAFTHPLPPILAEKFSSKLRFFIQNSLIFISSQTWDCDVLGSKKLCGKSISSGSWSSRSNVKTSNRKPDGKTMFTWLLDVRCSRKMSKTSILRFLLLNLFSSRRPMKSAFIQWTRAVWFLLSHSLQPWNQIGLNIIISVGMFTLPVCLTTQLTYLKLVSKKRVY